MQQVTDNGRLEGAYHQAKSALRAGRRGDRNEFARIANRMYDTLEACTYPHLTTARLIRRIGHKKALVLGFHRPVINLALKFDA